jgi:hypothetical protein
LIETSLLNTHHESHDSFSLEIQNVFEISKASEQLRFSPFEQSLHNKFLLWSGIKSTSLPAQLMNGFQIPSRDYPAAATLFGKGLTFYDCASKASNQCLSTTKSNEGFLILSEVALGNMHKVFKAEQFKRPPLYCHSVYGVG